MAAYDEQDLEHDHRMFPRSAWPDGVPYPNMVALALWVEVEWK